MTEAVLMVGVLYLIGVTQGTVSFVVFAALFLVSTVIDAVTA